MTSIPNDGASILAAAEALAPEIRKQAQRIQEDRRLPEGLLEQLRRAGVFRMSMPRAWGGPEVDPLTQVRVVEALARADASVGWIAMIGSDGGYYTAYLEDRVGRALYPSLDAVTAGFTSPAGLGREVEGGYRVSGRWPFGSAGHASSWLVTGFFIADGDQPRVDEDGEPVWANGFLPTGSCELLDNWDSIGLRGSDSGDYSASEVFVPREHTFNLLTGPLRREEPLYRFRGLGFCKGAGVPLGLGQAAIDALVELAERVPRPGARPLKHDGVVQEALARAEALVGSARSFAFDAIGGLWESLRRGAEATPRQQGLFRLALTHAASSCKEAVQRVYDAAAGHAVYTRNPFERLLRDAVTVAQHTIVLPKGFPEIGKRLLGLKPRLPLY